MTLNTFIYLVIETNQEGIELFLYHLMLEILLVKGEPHHNIFSGKPQPLNQDYFKTLWSRFKRQSRCSLNKDKHYTLLDTQGAIEIFKRTGYNQATESYGAFIY